MKPLPIIAALALLAAPAAAQDRAEVTEHHERLKSFVGKWTLKTRFNTGPDGAPEEAEGEEKVKLAKGGLWLVSEFKGQMKGSKFTGAGMMTYDVKKGRYVSTWIDSITSSLTVYEGTCDASGKVFTLTAETDAPELGGKVTTRLVYTLKDETRRTLTITLVVRDGDDIPLGTIDYTRADGKKKGGK